MHYIYELLGKTGLPKGVVNLVNGGKAAVDALSTIRRFAPFAAARELNVFPTASSRRN